MGRGKSLTKAEIEKIEMLKTQGVSNRNIALEINRSWNVISKYVKNPGRYGKNQKGGTRRAVTKQEQQMILDQILKDPFISARELVRKFGLTASETTIRRILKKLLLRSQNYSNSEECDSDTENRADVAGFCEVVINNPPNTGVDTQIWNEETRQWLFDKLHQQGLAHPDGWKMEQSLIEEWNKITLNFLQNIYDAQN